MSFLNQGQRKNFCFQAHVTMETQNNISAYIELCRKNDVKPVLIRLAQGDFVDQPMYTQRIVAQNLDDAMVEAGRVKNNFSENGFQAIRTKIEINAESAIDYFGIDVDSWGNTEYRENCLAKIQNSYFEVHVKVKYNDIGLLEAIAIKDNLYLSKNDREPDIRFLSVRKNLMEALDTSYEDNADLGKFYLHPKNFPRAFEGHLQKAGMEIIKEKYECCIYDSNKNLDQNWGFRPVA
ncbi:hypothetical protein IMSAGC019_03837 [Lachnospiraceae bacterium]|nr:hypothetical protein IMSAGC019_03837 [Lachnospiraceae bacterium]